jgi:hypothetical protein
LPALVVAVLNLEKHEDHPFVDLDLRHVGQEHVHQLVDGQELHQDMELKEGQCFDIVVQNAFLTLSTEDTPFAVMDHAPLTEEEFNLPTTGPGKWEKAKLHPRQDPFFLACLLHQRDVLCEEDVKTKVL